MFLGNSTTYFCFEYARERRGAKPSLGAARELLTPSWTTPCVVHTLSRAPKSPSEPLASREFAPWPLSGHELRECSFRHSRVAAPLKQAEYAILADWLQSPSAPHEGRPHFELCPKAGNFESPCRAVSWRRRIGRIRNGGLRRS